MYRNFFKRLIDLVVAFLMLVILLPILILLTLLLLIVNKGFPFFFQQRVGKHEKLFKIWKFRTMTNERDSEGNLLSDTERLTTLGRFVRKTSMDELPQLFNVFKGEMSLIGPRPLLVQYIPWYSEEEKLRHTVRPGITGLAQVSGRNFIKWDDRLALDVLYVKKIAFVTDMKIVFKTLKNVITSKDVAVDANALTEDFDKYRKKQLKDKKYTT